jgi:hypothetical protein
LFIHSRVCRGSAHVTNAAVEFLFPSNMAFLIELLPELDRSLADLWT